MTHKKSINKREKKETEEKRRRKRGMMNKLKNKYERKRVVFLKDQTQVTPLKNVWL
jgi:hypothetical protein